MTFKNSLLNIYYLLIKVVLLIKVLFITLASSAHSHEVSPAVASILQIQDGIQLEIRLNLEAILSGIDLSNISNTDEADQTQEYDFYRGRSVIDLKSDFLKKFSFTRYPFSLRKSISFILKFCKLNLSLFNRSSE